MLYLLIKATLSAIIIVAISEIGKRSPGFAALVASLPLVSVLGMIWLWRDTEDTIPLSQWDQPDDERLCKDCVPKRCAR